MSVSSRSSVAPTSRIDFTPEQTIVTPVRASVVRSADSSQLSRASRWTPPSPPVAKTRIPARAARWEVEATVVAAEPPAAITGARSRSPAFANPGPSASASSASSSSPIRTSPATTAIVAGTAPSARTTASSSRATSRFRPRGSPCAIRVLSSATTASPAASARATSGAIRGEVDIRATILRTQPSV